MTTHTTITLGLESFLDQLPEVLRNRRFGLLANQASVDHHLRYAWDLLAERYPQQLRTLFSPQHGLWGEAQANMVETAHGRHPRLGLPIYSLYSETRRPSAEMLAELEALVVDLQDVGTRVYTFIWTVSHCLEACAEAGIPVVILDRPNPLGGEKVAGPRLDHEYASFVGRASIPMQHGLTLAELTRYVNRTLNIDAELHIVPLRGWSRRMRFHQTGRTWVAPSPNVPRLAGVDLYPGQVLLEGTNLSEGRGTTTPFELVGAPFIDPDQLLEALNPLELSGIMFRPLRFAPTFDKWKQQSCGGLFLHITDPGHFDPYRTTVALLATIRRLWPRDFEWLAPPYEYETRLMPIDIITGSNRLRITLDNTGTVDHSLLDELTHLDHPAWHHDSQPDHLYQ